MFLHIEPGLGQIKDLPPLAHSRRKSGKVLSTLLAVGGSMLDERIRGLGHQERFARMTWLSALFFRFVGRKGGFDGFLGQAIRSGRLVGISGILGQSCFEFFIFSA